MTHSNIPSHEKKPAVEIAEGERREVPFRLPALFATFLLIAGCAVSYRIAVLQHSADINRKRDQVALQVDQIRSNLSRELHAAVNLTQGIIALIRMQGEMHQDQFDAMAGELSKRSPLIRNIALAPQNVVQFVYPLAGNEQALGLNYLMKPDQAGAVLRGIKEKRTIIAGPVKLVQGGIGIIGRSPIFLQDTAGNGISQRYWGMASTVLNFDSLLHSAGMDTASAGLCIALRGTDGTGAQGAVFWGSGDVFSSNPVLIEIDLPSGSWQLGANPCGGWPAFNPFTSPQFLGGSFISFIFALLFHQTLAISRGRAREILRRRSIEAVLLQKNRALRLFSECNSAVVHSIDEQALLSRICRIAVESSGYRMAWIGRAENDPAQSVTPVTFAGPGEGFLDKITVSWGDNEFGRGTAGVAIRTRRPCIARDLLNNPSFAVWREALVSRDFASAISVPLIVDNDVYGVLLIYAAEPDAFDSTEVSLLEELGSDISHGITAIRSRHERDAAIAALERARNELEERVALRTQELLLAKEAAESADRIKSAFLATMSHELRTPLNSIIGFTGIILQGLVGEISGEQRKQLGMVRDSARHLLALINDVLDISKIESGQLELHREVFALREAIDKSIQVVRPMAEKKSLQVSSPDVSPALELYSDRRRVEQILINLLGNAVKFTESGKIDIAVNHPPASGPSVRAADTVPQLRIAITDTGIGIRPEDMDKLFKPFKQLDTGTTRRYEGTGLGLSICKKLACMLGGDIAVRSDGPGKGATFTLTLPVTEAHHG